MELLAKTVSNLKELLATILKVNLEINKEQKFLVTAKTLMTTFLLKQRG